MIHIQSDRGQPHHFDAACAMFGAMDHGLNFQLTSMDEAAARLLSRDDMFVGSVEFMSMVFNRFGVEPSVPRNSNRPVKIVTIAVTKQILKTRPMFVKPVKIKQFTGLVMEKEYDMKILDTLPQDDRVMLYEPFGVDILSEWRVYVRNKKPVYAGNYAGDFYYSPDPEFVRNIIAETCHDFPCCYTIDVGILPRRANTVIEFNDMWAIGNYGMPNDLYFTMLKARYFEIVKPRNFF